MRAALVVVMLTMSAGLRTAAQETPAPQAPAQDETKVVVTASPLNPKDVFDTPYSADVLDARDGERKMPKSLPDIFQEVPGVNVQKTAYGHGSPFIRGFTGFRNLFLIDGVRLNSSAFRDGPNQYWNTVDSFLIGRAEVVRGPSSVLYGSDSLGGTVLVETPGIGRPEEGTLLGSRSYFRWASAEDSYIARQEVTVATPGAGFRIGGTYRDLNDLSGGRHTGLQPGTGYDEYDSDAKTVLEAGGGWRVVLAAQHTRQHDVPRTHSTVDAVPWHGTSPGTDLSRVFDQARNLFYAVAIHEGRDYEAEVGLSYHLNGEDSRRETATRIENRAFRVNTPGLFARVGFDSPAGFLTVGGEAYRDAVRSRGHDINTTTGAVTHFERGELADDSVVGIAGLYVQDEISLGSLDVTAGVRYSRSRIDAGEVDPAGPGGTPGLVPDFDETYDAFVGSLRLLYRADEHWNLVGGVSQGFRAPGLDDTTSTRLRLSGQTDYPNPDLDPEQSVNFEVGSRVELDPFEGGVFLFRSILTDFIVTVPAPSLGPAAVRKENGDGGWMHGLEAYGRYALTDDWHVWADFSYAFGKVDQTEYGEVGEEPIGKIPPAMGRAGIRYEPKGGPYWVELALTAARHQIRLSPSDEGDTQRIPPGGTPGFTVATLRGGVEVCKSTRVTAAVENVTDKDYRFHGSGTNEPGTNLVVGVEIRM